MGVGSDRTFRGGDEQAAGHAEMDDPLGIRFAASSPPRAAACNAQFADNVLAGAMDGEDGAAFKASGLACGRGFEGLAVAAEPGFDDPVAAHARVDSAGNGFYLRQLGHRSIVEESGADGGG